MNTFNIALSNLRQTLGKNTEGGMENITISLVLVNSLYSLSYNCNKNSSVIKKTVQISQKEKT
jgi:hypothetical protein